MNFDHNAIRLQIAENSLPRRKPSFSKTGPITQNRYSLTLWWPLGSQNISLGAKIRIQNFCLLLINQWLKLPGSTEQFP